MANLVSLDAMMRGTDFLNVFSLRLNSFIKYREVIINGIFNHIITPTPTNT